MGTMSSASRRCAERDMYWDKEYESHERVWGEEPSELARAALTRLAEHSLDGDVLTVLDIGCGYGRDAMYLSQHCRCRVLGIDVSERAIDIANRTLARVGGAVVGFRCCGFGELEHREYDVVYISNLYQVLRPGERHELRRAVMRTLRPGGTLFLSTLSVSDPQHAGKGATVCGDPNSFVDRRYVHLCTREELLDDFAFIDVSELYEHEYHEPRANGEVHHHISWILVGEREGRSRQVT